MGSSLFLSHICNRCEGSTLDTELLVYAWIVLVVNMISLMFDILDTYKYFFKGDRAVLRSEEGERNWKAKQEKVDTALSLCVHLCVQMLQMLT